LLSLIERRVLVKAKAAVKQPYGFFATGANIIIGTIMLGIVFVYRFVQGFGR
jgi:hypothetical protein|tara:strand:- start:242 stop:397 length:156 start_codon:yes stop_codon:yes gene_type:complete